MPFEPESIQDFRAPRFEEIIDVRSPAEFELDHVPGAVNLPVLDDRERAYVGTVFAEESRFKAHRIGAALVARNIATHLDGHLSNKTGSFSPLLYCWRGGQRSEAFAEVLRRVGWRAETVVGGYRTYRRLVVSELYQCPFAAKIYLLDGNTGTGKTAILGLLAGYGVQVLDLEAMANHRGSVLGSTRTRQPSQKRFESLLASQAVELLPDRPVVIEAESSKIGQLIVPPSLWKAMRKAGRIEVVAPIRDRARFLVREFGESVADRDWLKGRIDRLRQFHSADLISRWQQLADGNHLERLAEELMVKHYDPRYLKGRQRAARQPMFSVSLSDLSDKQLGLAAREIAAAIA